MTTKTEFLKPTAFVVLTLCLAGLALCSMQCAAMEKVHTSAQRLPQESKQTLGAAVDILTGNPLYGALTMLLLGGTGMGVAAKGLKGRKVANPLPKSNT